MTDALPFPPDVSPPWPAIERVVFGCWGQTRHAARAAMEVAGVPSVFYDWVETGLDTVSAAEFAQRDPFSHPSRQEAEYERLVAGGWLEPIAGEPGRFRVVAAAREAAVAARQADAVRLGSVAETLEIPPADLDALAATLRRIDALNLAAAEPPRHWATTHRMRVDTADASPLGRVLEAALCVYAYRDDAHLAAWAPYGMPGYELNAFTLIWQGHARFAAELASAAAFRGYDVTDYEAALADLVARGWIEDAHDDGRYQATDAGNTLREQVEVLTDTYFYAPWAALASDEVRLLMERADALAGELRALRRRRD